MPPGLDIGHLPNKIESKEYFGLNPSVLQCAFIGRVTQIKRPDRFLDVVGELKRRELKLEFLIAGDGELLNLCRERIVREDLLVKVLGWHSNIEKVLSAAPIFARRRALLTSFSRASAMSRTFKSVTKPVSQLITISGTEPTRVATTGKPAIPA